MKVFVILFLFADPFQVMFMDITSLYSLLNVISLKGISSPMTHICNWLNDNTLLCYVTMLTSVELVALFVVGILSSPIGWM
jgi:hypothetical protein